MLMATTMSTMMIVVGSDCSGNDYGGGNDDDDNDGAEPISAPSNKQANNSHSCTFVSTFIQA